MDVDLAGLYDSRFLDVAGRQRLWRVLVRDFFQRYVGGDETVLDMPCGFGGFINNVECGTKLALDLNPVATNHVAWDVCLVRASSTAVPLRDGSVDVVFISNFFEHLTRADIVATISECHRILRPSGRTLVLQPNIRFAARDYWMFLDHITPIDDRMLTEAFSLAGFAPTQRIVRFLPFTAQSRIPQATILVRAYLRMPWAWRVFGRQSFLVFTKR
ncbi:MAG TPA: class I SAM-dependent methyltransferase [Jatrophihabitantaceae bacterium]|nr:class I SAM-dependent methyltransferase [Jatrophihabitantaceae bacterium]